MKTLKDFQFGGKKVLLLADFNSPFDKEGKFIDDLRFERALPTIQYLVDQKAKIAILSHLTADEKEYSLKPVAERLAVLLKKSVKFFDDCVGINTARQLDKLEGGEIAVLENPRFHPGEEKNDPAFAESIAKLGDIFINDAFSLCHREHASVAGIPVFLPSGAGLLLKKEIQVLSQILKEPWRPLAVIIGGIKISAKIPAIRGFLEKADNLLLGGEIANVILRVKGICLSRPLPEEKILNELGDLKLTDPKLHLPVDVIVSPDTTGEIYVRESGPGAARRDEMILDIGHETVRLYSDIIQKAKMIIWSGPLGLFENPLFEKGTREIGDKIARNHKAFKVAGGGDTIAALKKFQLLDKFDFVSTGGSAMLKYLAGEKMPGIEALK